MEDKLLRFRNPQTGKYPQRIQTMDGFTGWAYDDCAKIAETRESAPTLADELISTETMPQKDESRYVLVQYPFIASVGESISVLYGMRAVVHGIFENVVCEDEKKAWIVMRITQVDPLNELIHRYPAIASQTMSDEIYTLVNFVESSDMVPGIELYVRNDEWEYAMMETTMGRVDWYLLYHDKAGKYHLALYGMYHQHLEFVQFGNCVIQYTLSPGYEGIRKQGEYTRIEDNEFARSMKAILDEMIEKKTEILPDHQEQG